MSDGSTPETPNDLASQREREQALDRLLDEATVAERGGTAPDPARFLAELRARIEASGARRPAASRRVRWSWAALLPLALVLYLVFGPTPQEPVSVAEAEVMEILALLTEGGDLDPALVEELGPETLELVEDWRDVNDPDVQLAMEDG